MTELNVITENYSSVSEDELFKSVMANPDFKDWMCDIRDVLARQYSMPVETVFSYGSNDNWIYYYLEGYSPSDAVKEDSEYWDAE